MNKTETKEFIRTVVESQLNTRTQLRNLYDKKQAQADAIMADYFREQGLDPAIVAKVFQTTSTAMCTTYGGRIYAEIPLVKELPEAYKQRLIQLGKEYSLEIKQVEHKRDSAMEELATVLAGLKTDAKIAKAFPEFCRLLPSQTSGALMDPNAVSKVRKVLGL